MIYYYKTNNNKLIIIMLYDNRIIMIINCCTYMLANQVLCSLMYTCTYAKGVQLMLL